MENKPEIILKISPRLVLVGLYSEGLFLGGCLLLEGRMRRAAGVGTGEVGGGGGAAAGVVTVAAAGEEAATRVGIVEGEQEGVYEQQE